jgi:hypothetical protein
MTAAVLSSSFSIATTVFVSLAICAVISYGVFYYFKQRLSRIEHSQMEQARIMQAIISRGLGHHEFPQPAEQKPLQKEITITQNSLIEVSSDDSDQESHKSESRSDTDDSDSDSESESDSESKCSDKWSIGDEIHQPDGYFEKMDETFKKNVLIDAIPIDSSYTVDNITIAVDNAGANKDDHQQKKIISLNKNAFPHNDAEDDADNDEDDEDDEDDDSSSEDQEPEQKQSQEQAQDQEQDQEQSNDSKNTSSQDFELKIGYKPSASSLNKAMQLNYGNMSVPALRQLAKERGLGGEDSELQKLKKKDLVQLLQ